MCTGPWRGWAVQPSGFAPLRKAKYPLPISFPRPISAADCFTLELLLFNTIEQHWIACSQPINHSEIKEKHLPLCFLMKAIFWLTAVFANMYKLLQNTLLSSTYHNMCLQLPHSFFLFLGTKAISSSIAGLQRKPPYKYIFTFNNGQQNF